MTENLDMVKRIAIATNIPLICDCDSGYGDIVIVNRMIREYEQAGATGVCIEDNIFPKRCSFYNKGVKRKLASVKEHVAKIKMATTQRRDKNFFIIARTEAFIAGLGLKEAIRRASAYAKAGADAVCIHSKEKDAKQVLSLASQWKSPVPLMAIPTTYDQTPLLTLYRYGYKIIVFANQLIRNSIKSMEKILKDMKEEKTRQKAFAQKLASLEKVFDIVGVDQMINLEKKFLK